MTNSVIIRTCPRMAKIHIPIFETFAIYNIIIGLNGREKRHNFRLHLWTFFVASMTTPSFTLSESLIISESSFACGYSACMIYVLNIDQVRRAYICELTFKNAKNGLKFALPDGPRPQSGT